jgi:hypothetical protein
MITKAIAMSLGGRATLYHATVRNSDGTAARCRVNGKCKTWKTRPEDFQLPVKHGLRDCFYITPHNAAEWSDVDFTTLPGLLGLKDETPWQVIHDMLVQDAYDHEAAEYIAYHKAATPPKERSS